MAWTLDQIPDLSGRTALITGANGGLGLETARELARRHAHVIMAARSADKGRAAADAIHRDLPAASLDVMPLDLSSLASVRTAAAHLLQADRPLDILVNNAGVMATPRQLTAEGFELQLGVNHFGHFVLTALLWPLLRRAAAARIVSVTSSARHVGRRVDANDPHLTSGYGAWHAYCRSKLANAHFALELDARARAAGLAVRSMAADPGFAATDLQAAAARASQDRTQQITHALVRRLGTTPLQGALPQLRAATDPSAVGGSIYGLRFIVRGSPVRMPVWPRERNAATRTALWTISESLTGQPFEVRA